LAGTTANKLAGLSFKHVPLSCPAPLLDGLKWGGPKRDGHAHFNLPPLMHICISEITIGESGKLEKNNKLNALESKKGKQHTSIQNFKMLN
jgi:hypothetical protein